MKREEGREMEGRREREDTRRKELEGWKGVKSGG